MRCAAGRARALAPTPCPPAHLPLPAWAGARAHLCARPQPQAARPQPDCAGLWQRARQRRQPHSGRGAHGRARLAAVRWPCASRDRQPRLLWPGQPHAARRQRAHARRVTNALAPAEQPRGGDGRGLLVFVPTWVRDYLFISVEEENLSAASRPSACLQPPDSNKSSAWWTSVTAGSVTMGCRITANSPSRARF